MEPVTAASAVVSERFPAAIAAFLGGSALSARRTPTSDLDVVVVLTGPPAPYRESLRWQDWPVELFVHDELSLELFFTSDATRRRPTLARMCTESVVLTGRPEAIKKIRDRAQAVLATGPPPLSPAELAQRRYGLTDLLDDLAGSTDPGETAVISWHVWIATAELALAAGGHWLGTGKWLLRELRAAEPELAGRLTAAAGEQARLISTAREVLARCGGPLWAGFRLDG